MINKLSPKYLRKKDVIFQEVSGKIHLLDEKHDAIVSLNETGSLIWMLITKPTSLDTISTHIADRYNVQKHQAEHDASSFVLTLLKSGFIVKVT